MGWDLGFRNGIGMGFGIGMGLGVLGWDGMGWDGVGWDGMGFSMGGKYRGSPVQWSLNNTTGVHVARWST